jgi:hypothetical protein
MNRFRAFLDREVAPSALRNAALREALGLEARWVPEELGDLEELEFGLVEPWCGSKVVFIAVLEHRRLKRISLGQVPEGCEDDDFRAFGPDELEKVVTERGERLAVFFSKLFPPAT